MKIKASHKFLNNLSHGISCTQYLCSTSMYDIKCEPHRERNRCQ